MKKLFLLFTLSLISGLGAWAQEHFISDATYYRQVRQDLASKEQLLPKGDLFQILKQQGLTTYEQEALTFLYAYMPESDIVDKSGDYFLENVRMTQKATQEMPWGSQLDENLIRYFVLPMRVNNEPLDDCRKQFYNMLKDRVKNKSLAEAIIEVNHWCHEHVIYKPSDGRTSSPLQSVRTAYGRCGEESTFLVSALRAVGIPARQVYTPRWAHTDDNHAWVEAWADGKWHFLGACEPEPVLDLGWFNASASRSMMVHTKVFGRYDGPEEVMARKANYTEINVLSTYAPTSRMDVQVVDKQGRPVQGAKVEFKLYNYAEFYTVATKYTDAQGKTFLTSGLGNLLVWASRDGKFGYESLSYSQEHNKTVTLNHQAGETYAFDLDIVPPSEHYTLPEVTKAQRAENTRLMEREDSIREAYVATMFDHDEAVTWCQQHQLDASVVAPLLEQARGNHESITTFFAQAQDKALAIRLLKTLSQKDIRDVPLDVLNEQLAHTAANTSLSQDDFDRYVLCPRVELEALTLYKSFFQQQLTEQEKQAWTQPEQLITWIQQHITWNDEVNLTSVPVSPMGVWKSRVADTRSRNIFFVSVLRALGQPARIDPVTSKAQYLKGREWMDVDFEATTKVQAAKGRLLAHYQAIPEMPNPKYYTHFTISKFKDGTFDLLSYDEGDADMGGGANYETLLQNGLSLEEGYYMMVSGNRQWNGSVLSHVTFFNIQKDQDTQVDFVLRKSESQLHAVGALNAEHVEFRPSDSTNIQTVKSLVGEGWYVLALLGVNQEPTNHVLRDIAALQSRFEEWGRPMFMVFPSESDAAKFRAQDFPGLPKNMVWGIDDKVLLQNMMVRGASLSDEKQLPILLLAHTDGRIVFATQGYTIGVGEQLMQVIHNLNKTTK